MFGRTRIIFYYKPDENIFGALMVKWWMSIKPAVAFLYCWAGLVIIWFMIYKCINVELKVAPSFFLCYQGLSQSFNFFTVFHVWWDFSCKVLCNHKIHKDIFFLEKNTPSEEVLFYNGIHLQELEEIKCCYSKVLPKGVFLLFFSQYPHVATDTYWRTEQKHVHCDKAWA